MNSSASNDDPSLLEIKLLRVTQNENDVFVDIQVCECSVWVAV